VNILFLAPRFPYPPYKGDQVRSYHQIRLLAKRHRITLLTFEELPIGAQAHAHIDNLCEDVISVPLHLRGPFWMWRALYKAYPLQTLFYYTTAMFKTIDELLGERSFDLLHAQLARVTPYFENISHLPKVVDFVDALSLNMWRRAKRERNWVTKLGCWIEYRRLARYERDLCSKFDQATIVSHSDRDAIGQYENLHVIPNGVQIELFKFLPALARKPNLLMFTGNMSYFPNVNAVTWFVNEVLPLIKTHVPDIQLEIVGVDPRLSVRKLALDNPNVTVTGHVPDIANYISHANVAIVPMQAGSGIQNKMLEAMACGTPVVATPFALNGVEFGQSEKSQLSENGAKHGEHLLVASDAESFANHILQLLQNMELREHLATNARKLVEQCFTWEKSVATLECVYEKARKAKK
jgi:sugar transferase (PEP-CTERM/EpsH1 system associated)